jgi:hypothetical protein
MREGLEKRVRNALIVGGIILGSLITGVKLWDYHRMFLDYVGMEQVCGREHTQRTARSYLYEHKFWLSKVLYLDGVKASEAYFNYHRMLLDYVGMEQVRGREHTRREAELYIQQHEFLLSNVLYLPEVKAAEAYLEDSSKETSNKPFEF